jgi:hypothetical protein
VSSTLLTLLVIPAIYAIVKGASPHNSTLPLPGARGRLWLIGMRRTRGAAPGALRWVNDRFSWRVPSRDRSAEPLGQGSFLSSTARPVFVWSGSTPRPLAARRSIRAARLRHEDREARRCAWRLGATINLSERGTRATIGIPGTGLSYSEKISAALPAPTDAAPAIAILLILAIVAALLAL